MGMAIETQGLTKKYRSGTGCFSINLKVPVGSVFGLLGSNGAGKSTLVKTLVGLLKPTSGAGTILGQPLGNLSVRQKIGYLPENFRYQAWMTGRELLLFHAKLHQVDSEIAAKRIGELLKLVKLDGWGDRCIAYYSKGMQQRIGLAAALIADPQLIFLDEPTSAMDPVGRRETRELILKLKEGGKTVFLNSHLLGEVETVCDQVAVMNSGQLVAMGSLSQLRGIQAVVDLQITGLTPQILTALAEVAIGVTQEGKRVTLHLTNRALIPQVVQLVVESGAQLYELIPRSRDLEELFLTLVQKKEMEG